MIVNRNLTALICPLTGTDSGAMRRDLECCAGADMVEFRLDYLQELPTIEQIKALLAGWGGKAIITCRTIAQGGKYTGPEQPRLQLLRQAADISNVFVDLELGDQPPDWPGGNLILSHHDFASIPNDLPGLQAALEASPAAINKLAFTARGPEDALLALDIVRSCRKPTISLAMGESGLASRILARKFGAFATFASLKRGKESAPGQPTIDELQKLYRFESINADSDVYGVIGCPIAHSMSPAIHNAAFQAVSMNAVYVPFRIESGYDNFARFMDALLARPWMDCRGLSVTIPHKESALAYVGAANCDELSARIGAVNTITISPDGSLRGDNTDYAAAIDALCSTMLIHRRDLAGIKVAVLGSGGVARAVVAALAHYRAEVTVYNRTLERAQQLAAEFECSAKPLGDLRKLDARIVINCTPIGMHPNTRLSPLEEIPPSVQTVFDTIYNPIETTLLRQAQANGCQTVSGLEMFVNQAVAQFEIWTDRPAPRDEMRQVVIRKLTGLH